MRNKNRVLSGLALLILSASAYSEDRVIEDSLIYKDPTVAKSDQVIYGASIDYLNISSSVNVSGTTPAFTYNYTQPGLTGFAGKGNFTASIAYKSGTSSYRVLSPGNFQSNSEKKSDTEVVLRWLAKDFATQYFTPYALIGYGQGNIDTTVALDSGTTAYSTTTSTATIAGLGAIFPLNEKFGVRVDARGYNASYKTGSSSSSFAFSKYVVTAYYNITKELNAQLGYQAWGDSSQTLTGYYVILGYTIK
jgi:hypothetical protein